MKFFNVEGLITSLFDESPFCEIIYLNHYKAKRDRLYPNAGYRFFTNFKEHKAWMLKSSINKTRKEHNDRVLREVNQGKAQA